MNKVKRLLIAIISLFVAFVFGWLVLFKIIQNPTTIPNGSLEQAPEEARQEIEIKLIFGQEDELSLSFVPWKDQITVYDALTRLTEENNIEIETQQYDFGVFVESIDGYENTGERAWIYFVNSESGSVAADKHELSPGDLVEWRYIEPEF